MDLIQYLEKTCNDCSNPCFVLDYETEELIFINQTLEKKFQVFEDYQGKSPVDVFRDYIDAEDYCPKENVLEGEYTEKRIYSKALKSFLRANTSMYQLCGRKFILTKFFMTSVDKKRVDAAQTFD